MAENLPEQLARWVRAGLLTADQAAKIADTEAAGRVASKRVSLVVEALGYVGGLLAVIGGFIAVSELWPDIPTSAEIAFAAAGTALLFGAGFAVPPERDSALARLRSVLWLLSTACLAATVALLTAEMWGFAAPSVALTTAAVATAYAVGLWASTHAALQHLAMFAGAAAVMASTIVRIDADAPEWAVGLTIWVVSVLWMAGTHLNRIPPRVVGYVAAAIGVLIGAQLTMTTAAGHVLALSTVAALLTAGILLRNVALLGIGAYGVLQVVPPTATRYMPESVGAPLALVLVGALLLLIALWLVRRGRPSDAIRTRPPRRSWRHRIP